MLQYSTTIAEAEAATQHNTALLCAVAEATQQLSQPAECEASELAAVCVQAEYFYVDVNHG